MRIFGSKTRQSSTDDVVIVKFRFGKITEYYIGQQTDFGVFGRNTYLGKVFSSTNNGQKMTYFSFYAPNNFAKDTRSTIEGYYLSRDTYNKIIDTIVDVKTFNKWFDSIEEI